MKTIYRRAVTTTAIILLTVMMQAQYTTFEQVYPATFKQSSRDIVQTSDGGYLIAGMTRNNIAGDSDIYILKTDAGGNILWTKTYGGTMPDYPYSIKATSDGNYFVLGFTRSFGNGYKDVYLLKIDPAGNIIWTKTFGTTGNDAGKEIIATADGNYVIAGNSNYKALLMKIDLGGNVLWTQTYGGTTQCSSGSVKQCLDGGYICIGHTYQSTYTTRDFLVRTNSAGDTLWTKTFSYGLSDEGKFILANNDGSFTFCATDSTGAADWDVRILKLDSSGNIIWNKMYGGNKKDICWMIQPTNDAGYIVAATSRSFNWINPKMWLLKLDANGDTLWVRHFGSWWHNHSYAAKQTSDGGYIAIGHQEDTATITHILFVRLDMNGALSVPEENNIDLLSVYPNPSSGKINLRISSSLHLKEAGIEIYNMIGEKVFSLTQPVSQSIRGSVIDLSDKPKGVYFVNMTLGNERKNQKIIIE